MAPPSGKPLSAATLAKQLTPGVQLLRHPWTRLAWSRDRTACTLYANGEAYPATPALAQVLCAQRVLLLGNPPDDVDRALLLALLNDGHLRLHKPRRR